MNHLIQAIDISGTRYCVKHGDFYTGMAHRWRTVSILSTGDPAADMLLVGAEDADEWLFDNSEDGGYSPQTNGEVDFGISCIGSISVLFDLLPPNVSGDTYDVSILLYPHMGGVIELAAGQLQEGGITSLTLTAGGLDGTNPLLAGVQRACGAVIGLRVDGAAALDGYVRITVIDVT